MHLEPSREYAHENDAFSDELARLGRLGGENPSVISTGGGCLALSAGAGADGSGRPMYLLATTNGEPALYRERIEYWSVGLYWADGDTVPLGMGEASVDAYGVSGDALETAMVRATTARLVGTNSAGHVARIDDTGVHFDAY
ncbi:hypothetical protein OPAG_08337 [Rhodococcus opacus PD630]|uniref:hypothetical protein n=1 Tax=Rhodococcus opacus TaxID=37919 RepID=UPI00029CB824|nr:hypothetical protein [Rhodococcus opacus]AHK35574.1 hypothetical protein Pd630_LPD10124 [Rhodococcus opacus PD630]EHI39106.1 hypothetical protein OPAG_08337 [Rhodococcus opacus PD630]UDH01729.1 hypothetical protein K2Z90_008252 [Rhodococcus opacus PD630]